MLLRSKTKIDEITKRQQEKEQREKQQVEKLKLACSEIFSNPNGKYFLEFLKNYCGWNSQDMNINPEVLIYQKGKRDVWVLMRNILPKKLVAEIEIYSERNMEG